ncbi:serine aminopeptidase domain-containing protein [Actinoallomurus iriomotensis]|uniref:Alpha/beta hydrolase n=1 Tax=Actinoallomurus iriomotensis TaxID=478107 RepID=A0A9W6SAU2_9ACTN|nr:alpha/beta hydrolase [Actinoallomurus iriomotensis]GLY88857.1 alpha/beta hydrolase [Actinoallomurus iriomotensis]
MTQLELLPIPMAQSDRIDIYSGVARMAGKVWGSLHRAATPSRTVAVIVHPTSNFMGHYLLGPLAERGIDAVGLTTRFIGNDSALTMENCVLDVGACLTFLRARGYEKVVLVGNSGGGGLAALYQSQAESPTITSTPAGDPPDLTRASLPPADAIVQLMAHPGRAQVCADWLDPAIRDESDPFDRDPDLDLFHPDRKPPFDPEFIERYRAGQLARNRRITEWVRNKLSELEAAGGELADLPFVVHGTTADPRFVDSSLDPSDRPVGTMWGPTEVANLMPASLGHYSSLRSWLSQWSVDESNGDGVKHLGRVSVPTFIGYGTADQVCFPSYARAMFDAVPHDDKRLVAVEGGTHYLKGQPELVSWLADTVVAWLGEKGLVR